MKSRSLVLLAVLLFVAALSRLIGPLPGDDGDAPGSRERRAVAVVRYVADGDTVKVSWQGGDEWVRLLRIDTPERGERGYGEARAALRAMAGGKDAELEFEIPGVPERDDYERILAYLIVDGRNLNVEMVRAGWSPFWTRYGEGRYADAFRRAEGEARKTRQGLWKKSE